MVCSEFRTHQSSRIDTNLNKEKIKPRVPLTILSGFLGVGKTTLLNRLLSADLKGQRVALIVNDFGKVVVDGSLIQSRGEKMLQLKNGCICCSLQQNLVEGMAELLQTGPFDRIVMETSGVTSLANLLEVLKSELPAFKAIRVDQVVTVVDAERFVVMSRAFAFVVDQVRHADAILMNRCDRVSDADRQTVHEALVGLNPSARIVETRYCAVDPGVLGIGTGPTRADREPGVAGPEHDDTRWYSSRLVFAGDVSLEDLRSALGHLPEAVMRIKGFVHSVDRFWSVQKAGGAVEIEGFNGEVEPSIIGQVVVIGASPVQKHLEAAFAGWSDLEIIEDTTGHDHHHHHP